MKFNFICKKCGEIFSANDCNTRNLKCQHCHNKLGWDDNFPSLPANEFMQTAEYLFEKAKLTDKKLLSEEIKILKKIGCDIENNVMENLNRSYMMILSKHEYNDDTIWSDIFDEFEQKCRGEYSIDIIDSFLCVAKYYNKNLFRKPYVIVVASFIEW